jgi:hypothetical protein
MPPQHQLYTGRQALKVALVDAILVLVKEWWERGEWKVVAGGGDCRLEAECHWTHKT